MIWLLWCTPLLKACTSHSFTCFGRFSTMNLKCSLLNNLLLIYLCDNSFIAVHVSLASVTACQVPILKPDMFYFLKHVACLEEQRTCCKVAPRSFQERLAVGKGGSTGIYKPEMECCKCNSLGRI